MSNISINTTPKQSDFGLIGLAVMCQNLVLNVESRGFQVSVYNRTAATTDEFVARHPGKQLVGSRTLEDFVASLARPRKIQIMVKAGAAVDQVIEQLIPLLNQDDIVIDGGNSPTPTPSGAMLTWRTRACALSARACRAARKAHARGRPSCRAGRARPGR